VRLPALVGNHMVLQRDRLLPIWGWAEPGEPVTVSFRGHTYGAVTAPSGKWRVMLPKTAAGGPFTMTIKGQSSITIEDILVGDVWLAAGQSNMDMVLRDPNAPKPGAYPLVRNAEQEVAQADFPRIRQFTVQKAFAGMPRPTLEGDSWQVCSPQSAGRFAAVPYFFARDLHQQYRVPIGIIVSSWGGSQLESWISGPALKQQPDFQERVAALEDQPASATQDMPTTLFNSMIAPLVPYALKGVIWYQGESNVGRAAQYSRLCPAFIQDWRRQWGRQLPFLFVQLANYMAALPQPAESDWALLREAQAAALSLPRTGMAVATDIGDPDDVHPANKQDVGYRLALLARAVAYNDKQVVATGPVLHRMRRKGAAVELQFGSVGVGLQALGPDGTLRGFAVAGADRQFHWATATLQGNTVVLTCAAVPAPVAVRYNWANNPRGNLYNQAGLPAPPFRTDTWKAQP